MEQSSKRARMPRRMAAAFAAIVAAGLLGACALEPGRAYDFSQVNGGFHDGYAQTGDAAYGYNNQPVYYPR